MAGTEKASALQNEQNIYATVKAVPYAGTGTVHTDMEYRDSEPVTSNTANTLYGDKTSGTAVQISAFRHLSNIRYRSGSQADTYTLTAKNMDWASVGTGLYDLTSPRYRSCRRTQSLREMGTRPWYQI